MDRAGRDARKDVCATGEVPERAINERRAALKTGMRRQNFFTNDFVEAQFWRAIFSIRASLFGDASVSIYCG